MALEVVSAGTGAIPAINGNFGAVRAASTYGRRDAGVAGLTWAFNGGYAFGSLISDGTVSLDASSTNYVVASRSTGSVTSSTSTTNWNDSDGYYRVALIVTGSASITSEVDYRDFTASGAGGGGGGGGSAEDVTYDNAGSGLAATNV